MDETKNGDRSAVPVSISYVALADRGLGRCSPYCTTLIAETAFIADTDFIAEMVLKAETVFIAETAFPEETGPAALTDFVEAGLLADLVLVIDFFVTAIGVPSKFDLIYATPYPSANGVPNSTGR
jgi:hypothetical protein